MVPDIASAEVFLTTLNESHPSTSFAMEITTNNKVPLAGMETEMKGNQLATPVHRKTTNKGILLHYKSHVHNIKSKSKTLFYFEFVDSKRK